MSLKVLANEATPIYLNARKHDLHYASVCMRNEAYGSHFVFVCVPCSVGCFQLKI